MGAGEMGAQMGRGQARDTQKLTVLPCVHKSPGRTLRILTETVRKGTWGTKVTGKKMSRDLWMRQSLESLGR